MPSIYAGFTFDGWVEHSHPQGMKRFTDTEKWSDPWYRKLSPKLKLFWNYICDKCDNAGVWKIDFELASFCIGETVTREQIEPILDSRVRVLPPDKWLIVKFTDFQFGKLSPASRPHAAVLQLLNTHGIDYPIVYGKPIDTPKDKDKDKDKEKDTVQDKDLGLSLDSEKLATVWQPDPLQKRFNKLFARRDSTAWSDRETKALRVLLPIPEDDLRLLEDYYGADIPRDKDFRRRDLLTLLNNFNGELDRARKFTPNRCF